MENQTINERVLDLRRKLNLTQTDFGSRIGVSQGHLTSIETGRRSVTEKTIKLICITYGVSEKWLRTGNGDIFLADDTSIFARFVSEYNLTALEQAILSTYIKLPNEQRSAAFSILHKLATACAAVIAKPEADLDIAASIVDKYLKKNGDF